MPLTLFPAVGPVYVKTVALPVIPYWMIFEDINKGSTGLLFKPRCGADITVMIAFAFFAEPLSYR